MNLNNTIRQQKRDIRTTQARINSLLSRAPQAKARFNSIMKRSGLGGFVPNPPAVFGVGATDDSSWYNNDFTNSLYEFGSTLVMLDAVSDTEKDALKLEIKKIEAQTASLDKQIALQKQLQPSYAGSFMSELTNSPIKMAAIAGLIGYFIYQRKPARKTARKTRR